MSSLLVNTIFNVKENEVLKGIVQIVQKETSPELKVKLRNQDNQKFCYINKQISKSFKREVKIFDYLEVELMNKKGILIVLSYNKIIV